MASKYSDRHSKPIGINERGWGGAGQNMDVRALSGDTDMITCFDDFNYIIRDDTAAGAEGLDSPAGAGTDHGWTVTNLGGGVAFAGVNGRGGNALFRSSLQIFSQNTADSGLNLQQVVDAAAPHATNGIEVMWLPDNTIATVMDDRQLVFACRVGVDFPGTTFNGKLFIGWAASGDTDVMAPATGALTVPTSDSLLGFHMAEDGHIDLICLDGAVNPLVSGTDFAEVMSTDWNDGTAQSTAWFDLALKVNYTDFSAGTGTVKGFSRRPGDSSLFTSNEVNRTIRQSPSSVGDWRHVATLTDNLPTGALGTPLVPTVEFMNQDAVNGTNLSLDWWSFGIDRISSR